MRHERYRSIAIPQLHQHALLLRHFATRIDRATCHFETYIQRTMTFELRAAVDPTPNGSKACSVNIPCPLGETPVNSPL